MQRFFEEVIRRKVLPVAAACAIGGWVLLPVGDVLFGGEPGVGKIRLGEEALIRRHGQGILPLAGHAHEETGTPFVTIAEILEEVSRALPRDSLRNAMGSTAPQMALLLPG